MYFTDRGIEELTQRRGAEEVSLVWVADRMREFVDLNPDFEVPIERLATWLLHIDDVLPLANDDIRRHVGQLEIIIALLEGFPEWKPLVGLVAGHVRIRHAEGHGVDVNELLATGVTLPREGVDFLDQRVGHGVTAR